MLHVSSVRWLRDYQLRIAFDNGETKDVDLTDQLYGEVFEPLREAAFFKRVTLNPETGTIQWPNGADFAPEYLLEIGRS